MAARPIGNVTVMLLGPMVQMDAGHWDELKPLLKRLNFKVTEQSPRMDGRIIKRVSRVNTGPKKKH